MSVGESVLRLVNREEGLSVGQQGVTSIGSRLCRNHRSAAAATDTSLIHTYMARR